MIEIHVCPLGERGVKAQRPERFQQLVRIRPQVALVLRHRVGNAGVPQLQIGHVALAVQVQHVGVVQLHPVQIFVQPPAGDKPRVGLHGHNVSRQTDVMAEPADAPGAVAAHLSPGAVGIVKMQPEIRLVRNVRGHEPVRPRDCAALPCQRRIVQRQPTGVDDHKVVARAVHIVNLHKIHLKILSKAPFYTPNRVKYVYSGVSLAKKSATSFSSSAPNISSPTSLWRMHSMPPFHAK